MALPLETVERIIALDHMGLRSSAIVKRMPHVAELTVRAVLAKPAEYLEAAKAVESDGLTAVDRLRENAQHERCPGCGGRVKMPCLKCSCANQKSTEAAGYAPNFQTGPRAIGQSRDFRDDTFDDSD